MTTTAEIRELLSEIRNVVANRQTALSASLRNVSIYSRVYTDQTIAGHEIMPTIVAHQNQFYASYIITAMQMNQYVANGKAVREILETVASEALLPWDAEDMVDLTNLSVCSQSASAVDLDREVAHLTCSRVIDVDLKVPVFEGRFGESIYGQEGIPDRSATPSRVVEHPLQMFVNMSPYAISPNTAGAFVNINHQLRLADRYRRWKAGEIAFIQDFLFERDVINRRERALREDNSGMLYEMLLRQQNQLSKALTSLTGFMPDRNNLANSIMVLSKSTFDRACSDAGLDFRNVRDKQRFFNRTFMLHVVVVDDIEEEVTMYINGIDAVGVYSFRLLQSKLKGGKNSTLDMRDIVALLAQGQAPRF